MNSILDEKTGARNYPNSHTYGDFDLVMQNNNQQQALSSANTQQEKGVAEIQASYVIAKKFPRNENQCYMQIIESCKRHSLSEQALYAYPRGGQMVTGPSIRLAETLARHWGNCKVGIEILSQTDDKTEAKAFALDLENNYLVESCFTVKHQRTTKKGVNRLSDERDIRELIANIGSRHLRGCILRVIPGDITESAIEQCKRTLETSEIPMTEQIKRLVVAFDEIGVKVEHLETRLGHNLDATIPQELVTLRSIYKSIKDGMAGREDFFDAFKKPEKKADEEIKKELENLLK
jgi:hypothetical protein